MISLLLGSFLSTAQAVPMQLSQQGRLVDSSGVAAAGNHNLTFRLYNASTGGTLLWNETVSTNFTNGYYSVVLGSDTINNPLQDSVLESGDLFIEIEIDSDGPLTPRSAVTSTPFARVAGKAQSADWGGLTSVPAGLSDGDDDTVGALSCSVGEQPVYNGSGVWECGNPVDDVDADNRLAALETLVASLQTDLATANSTIATLQSSVGTNTTDIASNASDITGLDTDITAAEGNITSLQASVTTNTTDIASIQSNVTTLQGSVLDLIDTDTTWNIGGNGDYSTLEDAMAAAKSVRVHPDATLTLQLENNIYTVSDEINLNHPDGANIVIQGNSADPALVQLEFAGTNGFYIDSGHVFGKIRSLTIRGDLSGTYGIYAMYSAAVHIEDIVVEDFYHGIVAYVGAMIGIEGDVVVQDNVSLGVNVTTESIIHGWSTTSFKSTNNGSDGIQVAQNATAYLHNVESTYNGNYAVDAYHNAYFYGSSGDYSHNSYPGVRAQFNAGMSIDGATISNNSGHGFLATYGSTVSASSTTISNNSSYGGVVTSGAGAYLYNSTISNHSVGVEISKGSYANLSNASYSGNSTNRSVWGSSYIDE